MVYKLFYHRRNNQMDSINEDQQIVEISIKRPFAPKFFKELNHFNEKMNRSKKKLKEHASVSSHKLQLLERVGGLPHLKSLKKLTEINKNGNRIFANWKNEQINGQAQIYYHNGVVFKGVYQNGIKIKGDFKFLNGYEYIGNCLGNKFFGEGSLIFPSGKIISGQWKEYSIIGNGKIEYPHGQVYYGEIQNFKKHGQGYLFLSDGSKYIGQFSNGLINGNGTYYVDDVPISKGLWKNGELVKSMDIQEINEESIEIKYIQQEETQNDQQKKDSEKVSIAVSELVTPSQQLQELSHNSKNKKVHFAD